MARKKKGGKKGRDEAWSDEEEIPQGGSNAKKADEPEQPQLSRKQKRQQKQKNKQQQGNNNKKGDSDNDSDAMDDDLAMLLGGKVKNQYGSDSDDDDSDDAPAAPAKPAARGKKNKQKAAAAAMLMSDSEDEDDEDDSQAEGNDDGKEESEKAEGSDAEDEEDDGDDGGFGGMTFTAMAPAKKDKKSSKKDKKEKKSKKDKKEKKSKKDKKDKKENNSDDSDNNNNEEDAKAEEKKSKFQLQMEAAMKKKEEAKAGESKKEEKKPAIPETPAQLAEEMDNLDIKKDDGDDGDVMMYGHPDDVVWSDKSQAHRDAEKEEKTDGPDPLLYDENGKKLSNKERKRRLKEREAAMRAAEYEQVAAKASREGAQFACSQTAVNEKDPQWENSLDINIPNFSISAAGKILFKDAAFNIAHGRRYGLVGPNGRGKSTLLKMIASKDLKLPPRIDFLYVEQEVVADDTPAVDAVLKADKHQWGLVQEEKELMKKVDAGDESAETIERLEVVVEELTTLGTDASEAKARRILYGLGFTMEMQTKPTKMFSGGWRMRISLARALFIEPTLLMLDEPTNHLDLNAVIWLDEYLQKWKKTLLVVSHDQDFLNSVCQEILHIEDLKLASYKGNYDSFKKAEAEKLKQQQKAWEKQEKRLKELKRSGQSAAKAQEAVKKNTKREAGARSQKKKNQAIAAGTETAEQKELIKRPKEYSVKLEFTEVADIGRPVMEVNRVHFRYSPKHPVIFNEIDFGIDMDSRICVVGPNGAGKSTLLKLLTGEVNATTGEVKRNPRLRMGIYNQHFVDRLPMNKTPVEHLRDRFEDLDYQTCRNRLGKYGLEGHAHEVVMRDLSGGQKARVVFVELSLQVPHILLLDEPTNNLDIETIDALVDAINEFNGGIVVVTHDQRLIEECDCTLWVVEKEGVTPWEAGFDDYKETILRELEEQVEKEAKIRQGKLDAAAAARAEKIAALAQKKKANKK